MPHLLWQIEMLYGQVTIIPLKTQALYQLPNRDVAVAG